MPIVIKEIRVNTVVGEKSHHSPRNIRGDLSQDKESDIRRTRMPCRCKSTG